MSNQLPEQSCYSLREMELLLGHNNIYICFENAAIDFLKKVAPHSSKITIRIEDCTINSKKRFNDVPYDNIFRMLQDSNIKKCLKGVIRDNLVKEMTARGYSIEDLSKTFGTSNTAVYDVLNKALHKATSLSAEDFAVFEKKFGIKTDVLLANADKCFHSSFNPTSTTYSSSLTSKTRDFLDITSQNEAKEIIGNVNDLIKKSNPKNVIDLLRKVNNIVHNNDDLNDISLILRATNVVRKNATLDTIKKQIYDLQK